MKQIVLRGGKISVEEVPAPRLERGFLLVQVDHSCLSPGTETAGLSLAATPLWKRALRNPEKALRVWEILKNEGLSALMEKLEGKKEQLQATGYAASGVVLAVGEGVKEIFPGDRVACAGAQYAYHAEVISVPENLAVVIPKEVDFASASTATLGAIALQGVRRLSPTLGESFVVIGLGVLGQLTVQILKANGCRVAGQDLDANRLQTAREGGIDLALEVGEDAVKKVLHWTDGLGADGVVITAASPSHEIVSTAFHFCRRKGRVVLVGDVGLNLRREDFYPKEIDFLISTSYGPGRYDRRYEEEGLDYPAAYVRWTENRNMQAYLDLLAQQKVRLDVLRPNIFLLEEAEKAYSILQGGQAERPLVVLLRYSGASGVSKTTRWVNPKPLPAKAGKIRLALIGAGSFALGMHLPNLRRLKEKYELCAVVSRRGLAAKEAAARFEARYATTDEQTVLEDPDIDAVLICTRHHTHAQTTLRALSAGKHVLVEKPLCLTWDEYRRLEAFFKERAGKATPVLMTGYNRRFSRYAARIQAVFRNRVNPLILNYRMNAGYLPPDHWTQGPEGGGRNLGEACHIYDLFRFLTGAPVTGITARAIRPKTGAVFSTDNFCATLSFEEGSLATLTYTALGSPDHPKELLEVYGDGKVLELRDYRSLNEKGEVLFSTTAPDKGHLEELEAFAEAIRGRSGWPMTLEEQLEVARVALCIQDILEGRKPPGEAGSFA